MLRGSINVTVRHCLIVIHAVHLRRLASLFAHVQTVVGTEDLDLLVFIFLSETLVIDVLGLLLQILPGVVISCEDMIYVSRDALLVDITPLIIELTLLILRVHQIILVPGHQGLILVATRLNLISEF